MRGSRIDGTEIALAGTIACIHGQREIVRFELRLGFIGVVMTADLHFAALSGSHSHWWLIAAILAHCFPRVRRIQSTDHHR